MEGVGWGVLKLNRRRRRRGDARKDPKCFDLSVRWVCGCMNLRPLSLTFLFHLSDSVSLFFPFTFSTPLSLSLSPFKVTHYCFSQTGISARFSSFLSEDHVRLLNVSASFVA